ncbi:MFS general substrate transporter [Serendipita vermifera]|nr:MFS general substrate transporter [Serendipita vermifera]
MGFSIVQVSVLLGLVAVISFSFECIFPFVNQFLLEIGVVKDPADVGFYSGIVESIYAVSSLLAVFPMTWASDYYGRKPVVIAGAIGIAISLSAFGMSVNYAMMIVSRIVGGVVGGSDAAMRVMASEMVDKASEAKVFAWMMMSYRTGQILGQPVGGVLAHPERTFPSLFGGAFWRAHPYALPCFVGAAYAAFFAIVGALVLRETLPAIRRRREREIKIPSTPSTPPSETTPLLADIPTASSSTSTLVEIPPEDDKKEQQLTSPSIRSVLSWPLVSFLISNAMMVLLTECIFAIYPLFAFTPVELGGLGLNSAQIGLHMSLRAVLHIVTMIPYDWMQKKWGLLNIYRVSLIAWFPSLMCFPVLNWMARRGMEGSTAWYSMLLVLWVIWSVTGWSWPASFVLLSGLSPSANAVATVQGLLSVSTIGPQAIAPALATSTFAICIRHPDILYGNVFWVAIMIFSLVAFGHSLTLRETTYDWRAEIEEDEEHATA